MRLSSNKCLIVDDEVAPDKLKREIFLNTFSISTFRLPLECCIFVHNYDEAVQTIETRKDLAFCFLDYRIPKNAAFSGEKSVNDRDFIEWGTKLIPLIDFPIFIYSGIVPTKYLTEEAVKYSHIVGLSKKPIVPNNIIPFPNKITSPDVLIETYLRNIFKTNLSKSTKINDKNLFDYASLDEETSNFVLNKTKEIKRLARRAVEDSINIGLYLTEIKEKLGHGNYIKWLKFEFSEFQPSHAATLMRTAERFKDVNFTSLNIVPSALYELSRSNVPDSAVEEVLNRARKGEKISNKIAKAVKLRYQEDNRNNSPKSLEKDLKEESVEIDRQSNIQQQKNFEVETTNNFPEKISPPPLLLNQKQQESLKKYTPKFKDLPKQQVLKIEQNVVANSFWQLGKHHWLFCGKPTDSSFLNRLPKEVALSIGLPPNNNPDLIPSIQAKAKYTFCYSYDDMDLSGIEEMVTIAIDLCVGENNKVVFSYISHLPVLNLAVDMGCSCYVAEPNLEICEEIVRFWQQKSSARRVNN